LCLSSHHLSLNHANAETKLQLWARYAKMEKPNTQFAAQRTGPKRRKASAIVATLAVAAW
jgi:hypothetical protein